MEDVILKLVDITKIYPNGTVANKGINIELKKGEIHSIVGENGAGKSTLMKIIFGIEKQTSGKIFYKGEEANFKNSMDAIDNGIGMVHQHFMLIPSFTVAENIVLGAEPKKGVFVNRKEALEKTKSLAVKYNFDIDVTKKVSDLNVSEKQKVEILKTLYRDAEVIILDEPTNALDASSVDVLIDIIKETNKTKSTTFIVTSHDKNSLNVMCDEIIEMRDGKIV